MLLRISETVFGLKSNPTHLLIWLLIWKLGPATKTCVGLKGIPPAGKLFKCLSQGKGSMYPHLSYEQSVNL